MVILGGGTAGIGIADQIRDQMARDGLQPDRATRQIWIVDLPGLFLRVASPSGGRLHAPGAWW